MSNLVVTVTPERAWLTQDRATWHQDTSKPGLVWHPEPRGEVPKVRAFPDRHMLVGGVGLAYPVALWGEACVDRLGPGDVTDTAEQTADELQAFIRWRDGDLSDLPADVDESVVKAIQHNMPYMTAMRIWHVGWSRSEGRCLAYLFDLDNGFRPQRVETKHGMEPAPCESAPGFKHLVRYSEQAERGQRVPRFHRAMLENQGHAMRTGAIGWVAYPSDTFDTGVVDANGVRVEGPFSLDGKAAA
ncbi:hypothetical protein [Aquisalimonas asiatica]|uniref:Uncharacterized protein n=1 Tax=Aquisalimonas asiatica TaxID=406100 RepID=A0A1H8TPH2_9GAMM|nr:hypothetical protein [Aquisalimonas asiatica]SEO92358.1 hypothetical protein SAMN04488052_104333 [Aquisalimonas asiatica]